MAEGHKWLTDWLWVPRNCQPFLCVWATTHKMALSSLSLFFWMRKWPSILSYFTSGNAMAGKAQYNREEVQSRSSGLQLLFDLSSFLTNYAQNWSFSWKEKIQTFFSKKLSWLSLTERKKKYSSHSNKYGWETQGQRKLIKPFMISCDTRHYITVFR